MGFLCSSFLILFISFFNSSTLYYTLITGWELSHFILAQRADLKNAGITIKSVITIGTPFLGSGLGLTYNGSILFNATRDEIYTQIPHYPPRYYNSKLKELNEAALNSNIAFHSIIVSEQGTLNDFLNILNFTGFSRGEFEYLCDRYKKLYQNDQATLKEQTNHIWEWLTIGTDNIVDIISQNLENVFLLYNHPFPRPKHYWHVVYLTNQEVKNSFWDFHITNIATIAHLAEPKNDNIANVVIRILQSQSPLPGNSVSPDPPDMTPPANTIPPSPSASDNMMFVSETFPDNSYIEPTSSFTKTWTIKNTGTTTWNGYSLVCIKSTDLSTQNSIPISSVSPGNHVTLSVPMRGPSASGVYQEYWKMKNSSGKYFGYPVWALIVVDSNMAVPVSQIPSAPITMTAGGATVSFDLKIRNTSYFSWTNDNHGTGVNYPGFAELRAVDVNGVTVESPLYPGYNNAQWINRNRIYCLVEDEVAPGETGTFRFQGGIEPGKAPGRYDCYFQPHIGHRGIVKNWPGMHFTINVIAPGGSTPPANTTSPVVNISAPASGATCQLNQMIGVTFAVNAGIHHCLADISYDGGMTYNPLVYLATGMSVAFHASQVTLNGLIRIRAYDTAGNFSTASVPIIVSDTPPPSPDPPSMPIPEALAEYNFNGNYTLRWNAATGAESYKIYEMIYTYPPPKNSLTPATYTTSDVQYTFTNRNTGEYAYLVRAINSDGESAWGGPVKIIVDRRPNQPPDIPAYPSPALNAKNLPIKQLTLSWASFDHDSWMTPQFKIGFGTVKTSLNTLRDYHAPNVRDTSLQIAGPLLNDTTYYWQVRAKDNRDAEVCSPVWEFHTAPPLPPGSPSYADETAARMEEKIGGYFLFTRGVSIIDVDNDGDQDIFKINDYLSVPLEYLALYLNDGAGHFTLRTGTGLSTIAQTSHAAGATWADYDGDGDLDVVITFDDHAPILYRNNGNYTFTDVTASAGLTFGSPAGGYNTAAWADFDQDGDMDLYCSWGEKLFRNNGNGTFTDISVSAGFSASYSAAAAVWIDIDQDGDLDLLKIGGAEPFGELPLYINNGNITFASSEIRLDHGWGGKHNTSWYQGIAAGDYNNDGLPDFYLTSYDNHTCDSLYVNNGDGTYSDVYASSGMPDSTNLSHYAVTWLDYDNDGWLDLAVDRQLYRNSRDGTFTDVTGSAGILVSQGGYGVVKLDADGNGGQDLYFTGTGNQLFMSSTPLNHWLKVKLAGTTSNRAGMGAEIRVQRGSDFSYRWPTTTTGWGCQEDAVQHFGIGNADTVNVRVKWPSGITDELFDVAKNQLITITEGSHQDTTPPAAVSNLTAFGPTGDSITLSWTVPGDDGNTRQASRYDIRWSYAPITESNWSSAFPVSLPPEPAQPLTTQHAMVSGLIANTTHYFALITSDEAGNESPLSNIAYCQTGLGTQLIDFKIALVGLDRIDLSWMAPDVLVNSYDIRYSSSAIDESNFNNLPKVANPPIPGLPGVLQTAPVLNLQNNTTFYFALKMIRGDGTMSPMSTVLSDKTLQPFTNTMSVISAFTKNFSANGFEKWGIPAFQTGDFNGDGHKDLVVKSIKNISGASYIYIEIYFSNDGTFNSTPNVIISSANLRFAGYQSVAISDINHDGSDDLIVGAHRNDAWHINF